ncbi:MAG: type II secretion system F family protein [Proteobacteria bacterium]|nr:type II secretion system F family protein [Pseudomonadota bacterium]
MNTKGLIFASSALASQLRAGLPIADAVARMARLQPELASTWAKIADAMRQGASLSAQARLHRLFSENTIYALEAGETSGFLVEVLTEIERAATMQLTLQKALWKFAYPVGILLASIGIFIFFMLTVIPSLMQAIPTESGQSAAVVQQVSTFMVHELEESTLFYASALVFGLGFLIWWLSDSHNREVLLSWLGAVPRVGEGLKEMYYGIWAINMALLDRAGGIGVKDALLLSARMLPFFLQEPIRRAALEVEVKGLARTFDVESLPPADPRQTLPFLLCNAFVIAQQTGLLSDQLSRVATELMYMGERKLEQAIQVANMVLMMLAGTIVLSPLVAYYMQLGASLSQIG